MEVAGEEQAQRSGVAENSSDFVGWGHCSCKKKQSFSPSPASRGRRCDSTRQPTGMESRGRPLSPRASRTQEAASRQQAAEYAGSRQLVSLAVQNPQVLESNVLLEGMAQQAAQPTAVVSLPSLVKNVSPLFKSAQSPSVSFSTPSIAPGFHPSHSFSQHNEFHWWIVGCRAH